MRRFLQTFQTNRFQITVDLWIEQTRLDRFLIDHLPQRLHDIRCPKRRAAREDFVQNRPQRVDVARRVDLLRAAHRLFWRHVARRAHDRPAGG